MERLETYDPWEFVEWALTHERMLYVRIAMEHPKKGMLMTLVPLGHLAPEQWVFWVKRFFFDRHVALHTLEEWRSLEQQKGLEPAARSPYDTD